jgi:hypothetical protein
MALLAEPPYAQRLLDRSEVQETLRPFWPPSRQSVGQQLIQPQRHHIALREDVTINHGRGVSFGGNPSTINPVESTREPTKHALLGHLIAEPGLAFELVYVKYLLGEGRVTMAREILQRLLLHYPADEILLNLYNAISPGKVVRTNMHYSDRTPEMEWIHYRTLFLSLYDMSV